MDNQINNLHQNQNSDENHIKTLEGAEALKKFKDIATAAENCFFVTSIKTGFPVSVLPMAVQQVDDEGNLWFMALKVSAKIKEIATDPLTHLFFQESKHAGFLNIYGITEIVSSQEKIDELWTPILKVWFPGGKNDNNITLLKVVPINVYYWDTKNGSAVAFAKMALSLVTEKSMDGSVEGNLNF
ncbi:MAG: general stress protein [Sphingobacteriales bacterium]|nr:MAG: general stress protein [Sphingobacteriales bacterium]